MNKLIVYKKAHSLYKNNGGEYRTVNGTGNQEVKDKELFDKCFKEALTEGE